MRRRLAAALLGLALCGCHGYKIHPGAVNAADSAAYDVLLTAQTSIDQLRAGFANGTLPASAVPLFNNLVQGYNATRESWLLYRGALATGTPSDTYLTSLNQDIAGLNAAIAALRGIR